MKLKLAQFIWIFLAVSTSRVWAADLATVPTLSAIREAAEAAVAQKIEAPAEARVEIQAQSLDNRMSPPRCSDGISATLASNREIGKNNTVKVQCHSPDLDYPWQIFLSVRVDILFPMVVATRPVGAGELIGEGDVTLAFVDKSLLRGQQFAAESEVIGTRAKRRIAQDAPVYAANLCFVCRGDSVAIIARSEHFQIKTLGEALADGNIGDKIRVRNSSSNKELEAKVTGVGEVEVKM
ncbi:flagellar basal body P-ring formation protein FlgA [Shewanella cyperi]|uniref:Flagella basal body P-ring formation protein FlgA n=1 Tax=Shewanella cyperi TaxID=2814292 RepID=A0A974XIF8_9GAMM|nr:flagellar basal body P-ring formation chaperone FlgA [Shewanella cyperi]QSX28975.1 flagellar basal body P-ring formation protein FlgA [Shewanella cyperi]